MKEEWKEINRFDGRYSISNLGRIRQNNISYVSLQNKIITYKEKIIEPFTWQSRYLRVDLMNNKKYNKYRLSTYVHKLVAEYFIGERPEGYVIDHIDGDYLNNRVDNLRYVTQKENCNNPNTVSKLKHKLTEETKLKIRETLSKPEVKEKLRVPHKVSERGREVLKENAYKTHQLVRMKRMAGSKTV